MGAAFGFIGSCLGSCAASAVCSACNSCAPKSNNVSYHYAFLTFMASLIAVLLQQFGHRPINGAFKICGIIPFTDMEQNCEYNASPFRILSVLSWFFIVHVVMTRVWASFHKSFWLMKLLLFTGVVITMYFVPNDVFEGYAKFAVVGASIFMVLQMVIFINMCYDWNEAWVSREWYVQTIAITFLMYAAAGTLYAVSFVYYGSGGCNTNQAHISMSIIVSFLLSMLSVHAPHGAILPSAGVTLYLSWILFSGLSSGEDTACNATKPNKFMTIGSLAIMCVGIGYFCMSNSAKASEPEKEGEQEKDQELESTASDAKEEKAGQNVNDVDVERANESNYADLKNTRTMKKVAKRNLAAWR